LYSFYVVVSTLFKYVTLEAHLDANGRTDKICPRGDVNWLSRLLLGGGYTSLRWRCSHSSRHRLSLAAPCWFRRGTTSTECHVMRRAPAFPMAEIFWGELPRRALAWERAGHTDDG
jgi:hypothetical protein